jgi:nucleoside-diphosphate-sugar epimerase
MDTRGLLEEIWNLSKYSQVIDQEVKNALLGKTKELLDAYQSQGRALADPFEPTRIRTLSLPEKELGTLLNGSVCLVTGGSGCVGTQLVRDLMLFCPKKIIVLDCNIPEFCLIDHSSVQFIFEEADIRNYGQVEMLFKKHQPDFVFHLAAQRNPGLAEKEIELTVSTNVLGSYNLILACEATPSVQRCVFSSTGKASRYFTEEIYAGTKKICEHLFTTFHRIGNVKYGMARFTHILENSLMNQSLLHMAKNEEWVRVHNHSKFVTAQNVGEASRLLLNALLFCGEGECEFHLVKHLEWPVESLEVALYYIHQEGTPKPIIFTGNPKGYGEKFFRGQLDWSIPHDLNLLINVYENKNKKVNKEGDIISSSIVRADAATVENIIKDFQEIDPSPEGFSHLLSGSLERLFMDSLSNVNPIDTISILKWGTDEDSLEKDGVEIDEFDKMIGLFLRSLEEKGLHQGVYGNA